MRPRRPGFSEPELVYSNKSTNIAVGFFHALLAMVDTTDIKSARVAIDVYAAGLVGIKIALQQSDDGITWPSATTVPTQFALAAATGDGQSFATTFEDISASITKRYLRFGVWVYNSSGTNTEFALVAIRVETRSV